MLTARTALPCPFPRREAMTTCALVLWATLAAADEPVVLEFATAKCPACRKVDPVVRGLAAEGFPIKQVDAATQSKLAQRFNVRGYPTFVLVAGGREVNRLEGVATREQLIELLRPVALESRLQAESSEPLPRRTPAKPTGKQELLVRGQSPTPAQAALAATVRIRVNEGATDGIGTGTIIDTHYNEEQKADEALIVTCGHIFRQSKGQGKITVEIFTSEGVRKVEGSLLDFDDKRDVALVTIWPGSQVAAAQVAPKDFVVRPQDAAFSVGCSNGQDPTVEDARITAVNRFISKPNYTAAGSPPEGRSGGGLFSAEGYLIGVCNANIPDENQGLYASLPSVHGQLDKFNLQQIYDRAAVAAAQPAGNAPEQPATTNGAEFPQPAPRNELPVTAVSSRAAEPSAAGLPELARSMPRTAQPAGYNNAQPANHNTAPQLEETAEVATQGDVEVVVIVRSKNRPESSSEIYQVDNASPDLIARITTAARASAQARTAQRQSGADPRFARQNRPVEQPVIRGQLK
jgi:thiol-disulfide isomerase/thioredoxin